MVVYVTLVVMATVARRHAPVVTMVTSVNSGVTARMEPVVIVLTAAADV